MSITQLKPKCLTQFQNKKSRQKMCRLPITIIARACKGTPPPSDLAGGVPQLGVPHLRYPHQTWWGGYPTLGTPQSDLADRGGGYPTSYRITDGVLDTPRSVCLLRSRRRTFFFTLSVKDYSLMLTMQNNGTLPKCEIEISSVFTSYCKLQQKCLSEH